MRLFKPNIEGLQAKKNVTGLIGALRDQDADIRRRAAGALGEVGDPRAVDSLIMTFRDADIEVRKSALSALVKIRAQAIQPLIVALKNGVALERMFAAWALGDIGSEQALEPLIGALKDADGSVRYNAVRGLNRIGGERVIAPLISVLDDQDGDVRKNARQSLVKLGAPSVSSLTTALKSGSVTVRCNAAWILGDIGDARAVEPLIAATQDPDDAVRQNVAYSLGQIGDAQAAGALIKALGDNFESVRQNAMSALMGIHLNAQAQLDPQIQSALLAVLQHPSVNIRQLAVQKLDELGWKPDVGEAGGSYWAMKQRWDQCVRIGAPAVKALVAELNRNPSKEIIGALAQIGDARAIQPLIDVCTRERDAGSKLDGETLESVAAALGGFGEPAVSPLLETVKQLARQSDSRETLLKGLDHITEMRAANPLAAALAENELCIRDQGCVVRTLARLGGVHAVKPLILVLNDPAKYTLHQEVAGYLSQIGDPQAVKPLIAYLERLKDSSYFAPQREVIIALARFGDRCACASVLDALFGLIAKQEAEHPPWQDDHETLQRLFSDYTGVIIDLVSFKVWTEEWEEADQDWYEDRYAGGRRTYTRYVRKYATINNLRAIETLCSNASPVASNLLHKVTHIATGIADELRKMAKAELVRRGDPPYDPSVFLDATVWRLPD